jgi:hypothetical protein
MVAVGVVILDSRRYSCAASTGRIKDGQNHDSINLEPGSSVVRCCGHTWIYCGGFIREGIKINSLSSKLMEVVNVIGRVGDEWLITLDYHRAANRL